MYELTYSRHRSAYILVTEDSAPEADALTISIIQANSVAEALQTARTIANGPVELAG